MKSLSACGDNHADDVSKFGRQFQCSLKPPRNRIQVSKDLLFISALARSNFRAYQRKRFAAIMPMDLFPKSQPTAVHLLRSLGSELSAGSGDSSDFGAHGLSRRRGRMADPTATAQHLLKRLGRLHAVRSVLSLLASLPFVCSVI
jgi:hypothetical protein